MKRFQPAISWIILIIAAVSLIPPHFERLLVAWVVATLAWIIAYRRNLRLLPAAAATGALAAALLLPAFLPTSLAPLMRLGITTLAWSIILGIALRVALRIQTATHLQQK